jgi:hypothetical protein
MNSGCVVFIYTVTHIHIGIASAARFGLNFDLLQVFS